MQKRKVAAKFYEFRQNNSGGSFDIDDKRGIGPCLWIEALSNDDALNRAESLGLYFNGVENGIDCPCCGDRWSTWCGDGFNAEKWDEKYDFNWHDTVYVHHMDGKIEKIKSKRENKSGK